MCSLWEFGCAVKLHMRVVPFQVGSVCYLSEKVRDLVGHTRHTGQSASRGTSGLCGGPA